MSVIVSFSGDIMLRLIGTNNVYGARVVLRRFDIYDTQAIFYNWTSDSEVCKYLTWGPHLNVQETFLSVKKCIDDYIDPKNMNWVIIDKYTNDLIGSCSIHNVDVHNYHGEIGCCLAKKFWGKGYGSEVVLLLLDYGFAKIGFNRICGIAHVNNTASQSIMKKAGMCFEGKIVEGFRKNDIFFDGNSFYITKSQYFSKK